MNWKRFSILLLLAVILSNFGWALAYRSLWYDAAQTEGLLSEAESYIHSGGY